MGFPIAGIEAEAESIRVDDYADDIQAALDAAAAAGIPLVLCNPTKTYVISTTINIPPETMLDGGGQTFASAGATGVGHRAHIEADASCTGAMIDLDDFSGIRGFWLDGGYNAAIGIQCVNLAGIRIIPFVMNNYIRKVATGIKFGGVTYFIVKHNGMNLITDIGLDALAAYSGTYYGGNVGVSEMNSYKGDNYRIRFEGILTSISDTTEGNAAVANIATAGTHTSYITLIDPYCELADNTFFKMEAGAELRVIGGFIDADVAEPGTIAFDLAPGVCDTIYITGLHCQQFKTVFAGTTPTKGFKIDRTCEFNTYDDFGIRDMTLFAVGDRCLDINLPREGLVFDGFEKEWVDGTVADFDCMASKTHEMKLTGPATIRPSDATAHLVTGHTFSIEFDGYTTLDHGGVTNRFALLSGADETPANGMVKWFILSAGFAREIAAPHDIGGPHHSINEAALTSTGGNIAIDASESSTYYHDIDEDAEVNNPTAGLTAGRRFSIRVEANGTNELTWGTYYNWGTGSSPDFSVMADGDLVVVDCYAATATLILCTASDTYTP